MATVVSPPGDREQARARAAREPLAGLPTRRLALSLYFTGALFILTALGDALANSLPLSPSVLTWRYGAVGAMANYLISPLFGALLMTVTAALLRHRRTLRVLGFLWAAAAALMVLLAGLFALDVLQLRGQVPPDQLGVYQIGAVKSLAKYLLGALAFGLFAATGLQRRSH